MFLNRFYQSIDGIHVRNNIWVQMVTAAGISSDRSNAGQGDPFQKFDAAIDLFNQIWTVEELVKVIMSTSFFSKREISFSLFSLSGIVW